MFNPTNPFEGGRMTRNVTKKHKPLVWENMLATVCARNPITGETHYFDYDYNAARDYAQIYDCTDLRISRVHQRYQGWPRRGQLVLWGIPPEKEIGNGDT